MNRRRYFTAGPRTTTSGADGRGCRIATAIGLGLIVWMVAALVATAFGWNLFVPPVVGLAVAVGVGAGPYLGRAANAILGPRTWVVANVAADLLLAAISVATLLLAAWLAGYSEVTCTRERPEAEAQCVVQEYRWLGRALAVDRTVAGVSVASVRAGIPAGIDSDTNIRRGRPTPNYALELETASGPVLVTDASRPSAAAAAEALNPLLSSRRAGRATARIVDWLVPASAGFLGLVFSLLPIRRAVRRVRAARRTVPDASRDGTNH